MAKYIGNSDFRPSITGVESKKVNARKESMSVAVGLSSFNLGGKK